MKLNKLGPVTLIAAALALAGCSSNDDDGSVLNDPADTPDPLDTPNPLDTPDPLDAPDPLDTPEPLDVPDPLDPPDPVETPDPVQTPDPVDLPDPLEIPDPIDRPDPIIDRPDPIDRPDLFDNPDPFGAADPTIGTLPGLLEVRDSFTAIRRPEALDAIQFISEFFDASLTDERPNFQQREVSIPFSTVPLVNGLTESVLINIDAGGTGTYRDVSTMQDPDTIRRESAIATRTFNGNSIVWAGTHSYSDSSSGLRRNFEFTTEISAVENQMRFQTGSFKQQSSGDVSGGNQPINGTYELTTGLIEDGTEGCFPFSGTIVYDSVASEGTPPDVSNVNTVTTIEKLAGESYWTVRERNLDESLREEYMLTEIGLTPFCDVPEL